MNMPILYPEKIQGNIKTLLKVEQNAEGTIEIYAVNESGNMRAYGLIAEIRAGIDKPVMRIFNNRYVHTPQDTSNPLR